MKIKVLAVTAGLILSMASWASSNYVQAVPQPAATTQAGSNATTNAFGQSLIQNPAAQQAAKTSGKPAAPGTSMDQSAQATLSMSRVMQVDQDFLNYQSQTNDKLNQMQANVQQLSTQITTLTSQLSTLSAKVDALTSNQQAAQTTPPQQPATAQNIVAQWEQTLGPLPFYGIIVVIALLLAILVIALFPRKKKGSDKKKEDMKTDYDYLSTKEAIPAKLDLAHSYIVMEDYEAAEAVLKEVIEQGAPEQVKRAKALQKECQEKHAKN
jgi:FimV-like protein